MMIDGQVRYPLLHMFLLLIVLVDNAPPGEANGH